MLLYGDALEVLKTLDNESVQCCVTSPPYYGLRDYGQKGQIGLEQTPQEYVLKLVDVFRDVWRILKKDGTLWLNLGDSYASSTKGSGGLSPKQTSNVGSFYKSTKLNHGLKDKNLMGIPWRVAFALQDDGWYLRQDIIWHKPNPMPESIKDRCTKSHEYIFLLTKSARYFYNADAIAEPISELYTKDKRPHGVTRQRFYEKSKYVKHGLIKKDERDLQDIPNRIDTMRNKRSVWTINLKPYPEAHFATFPEELPRICILAGTRKGDTVLDPFLGAGTTGVVCEKLERNFVGIELSKEYLKLAEDRIYNVNPLFRIIKEES